MRFIQKPLLQPFYFCFLSLLILTGFSAQAVQTQPQAPFIRKPTKTTVLDYLLTELPLEAPQEHPAALTTPESPVSQAEEEATTAKHTTPVKAVESSRTVPVHAEQAHLGQAHTSQDQKLISHLKQTVFKVAHGSQTPQVIRVQALDAQQHQAIILINDKEVLRLRSANTEKTTYQRAVLVATRLKGFLEQGGSPRDILPVMSQGKVAIRAGKAILLFVDPASAKLAKQTEKSLALAYVNQLRQQLGAPAITRDEMLIASRGLSTAALIQGARGLDWETFQKNYSDMSAKGVLEGHASWYGPGFHGRRAADGSRYNMYDMTAAHKTLPFGTVCRVRNKHNGKSCVVRITDRGPYVAGRIIDLSKGAADMIGMSGVAPVSIEILTRN